MTNLIRRTVHAQALRATLRAHPLRYAGFTLIELLIVLSIIGLLTALMAPTVGKMVDSAAAQEEWLTLERQLNDLSFGAYVSGSPIEVQMKGAGFTWQMGDNKGARNFNHLFFDEQRVIIRRNGLASVDQIRVVQRGRPRTLSLAQWNREDI